MGSLVPPPSRLRPSSTPPHGRVRSPSHVSTDSAFNAAPGHAEAGDAAVVAGVSDLLAIDFLRELRIENLESPRAIEHIGQALGGPVSRPLTRLTQASTLVAARHTAGAAVLDDKTARRFARATNIRLSGSVGLVKAMAALL